MTTNAASSASLEITDPTLLAFVEEIGPAKPMAEADPSLPSSHCRDEDPVVIVGNRTRWDIGGSIDGDPRPVKAPTGIVSYAPEEMTVTVRAGTSVAELDEALADAGQLCALPDRGGTVGGSVAVGQNDLLTLGKGRLRSSILQVRYVSGQGRPVTGGGPTVKNVTGFDIPRLMTGSLGTLGFLSEVILRTNPIPTTSVWYHSTDGDPFAAYDSLLHPSAVLWDGSETWVLVEGHPVDVKAETKVLQTTGRYRETDGPPQLPPHRWSLPPGQLRTLEVDHDLDQYVASVGVGTVFATTPQPKRSVDPVSAAISARMKHLFDPSGRLNPGRVAGP